MYNNALDGVSASGNRFFYVNRLASAGDGRDVRWERASLECCPPNLVRFLASMPGYIYAQDRRDAIYVNLYVSSETSFKVGGKTLGARTSRARCRGAARSTLTIRRRETRHARAIKLRIPGWARNQPVPGALYCVRRTRSTRRDRRRERRTAACSPRPTDSATSRSIATGRTAIVVDDRIPDGAAPSRRGPRVKDDRGRVAIERGPIVYCAEWPDVRAAARLDLVVRRRSVRLDVGAIEVDCSAV